MLHGEGGKKCSLKIANQWRFIINIQYSPSDRSLSAKVLLTSYIITYHTYYHGLRKAYPLTTELKALSG